MPVSDGLQNNDEGFKIVKMKINSDCTDVVDSSNEQMVKYGITNKEVHNEIIILENCDSDDGQADTISKCKNSTSEKESTLLNNSTCSIEVENNCSVRNNLNKSEIDDNYLKINTCIKGEPSLDNAFDECLIKINSDLSFKGDVILNELINESENKIFSNVHNKHKRKMLHTKNYNSDSYFKYDTKYNNDYSYYNKNVSAVSRQKLKYHKKIAKSIFKKYDDQSYELNKFKTTLERFLQKSICLSLPGKISKCIECRFYQMQKNLSKCDYDNITCRFYAFRQLKYNKFGSLAAAGYPDPYKNLNNIDLNIWLPSQSLSTPSSFNIQASMKILEDIGGQFCKFVQDENEALKLYWPDNCKKRKIVWKKCVNGVREMCDVCRTTIFNYHWSCGKCGFVVCVDCFKCKLKRDQSTMTWNVMSQHDEKKWLPCSNQVEHQIHRLSITQILAGNALNRISILMHDLCSTHKIPIDCNCNKKVKKKIKPPISNNLSDYFFSNEYINSHRHEKYSNTYSELKDILVKECSKYLSNQTEENKIGIIKDTSAGCIHNNSHTISRRKKQLKIQYNSNRKAKELFIPKLSLMIDGNTNPPHMWLCEGHVLRLLEPKNLDNYVLFQSQWKRGLPVLVSDVGKHLNASLWHPESFIRDFGDQKNDLINCVTTKVISDQPMSKFWNGFEDATERLTDKQGNPMLLKLKDWPPSVDFAETLPDRFQDLMECLPLKEYTQRNGRFNLASRLPDCFVRPDLGPKMYTAYGNAGSKHKKLGTTNLHLDISDAVNVMVYVAVTKNCSQNDYDWYVNEALRVIDEAGCDDLTKLRVNVHGELPGALWHIYHESDADSIRDLLIKVAIEHGISLEQWSDPIHDQSHYLDTHLRERLFREYGVKGYTIVQFSGDAVFIPAGAPHQVRNLHNCIKVAEDFVSPENVHHSFQMTQEFRNLTDSHTNHEDKLQIKNIVFHAVKDSISILMHKPVKP